MINIHFSVSFRNYVGCSIRLNGTDHVHSGTDSLPSCIKMVVGLYVYNAQTHLFENYVLK